MKSHGEAFLVRKLLVMPEEGIKGMELSAVMLS